ncbi:MAG: DUF4349 domain-containing protein [Planctomycetes bacterium]|nr:DUF4349 domain-containing protein [Planctomycetota bacterium]MCL4729539.1 DUF4349 domain-containing protein [Planctomycetota bacterium]
MVRNTGHDWSGDERGGVALSHDELAVLDHVSGLTAHLPAPQGRPCEDRAIVGELMAMRAKVGSLAITPPKMKLTFDDILQAADQAGPAPEDSMALSGQGQRDPRVIYWLTSRWGIGLVTAASVAVAFITGAMLAVPPGSTSSRMVFSAPNDSDTLAAESSPVAQQAAQMPEGPPVSFNTPKALPVDTALPSLVRSGSIHLRYEDPGSIQQRVTDLVTSEGGAVTNLTRQGTGRGTEVSVQVAVPAHRWRPFLTTIGTLGEVLGQTETADEVTGQKIDLKARLAEAEDYLKRLDALAEKPQATLGETQNLERERRDTRREIERLKAALAALENRIALSRLDIRITAQAPIAVEQPGPFEEAWKDGTQGLEKLTAFGLKAGIAGSPLLLAGTLAYLALRRKRRKISEPAA